jgi:hypothetical protein
MDQQQMQPPAQQQADTAAGTATNSSSSSLVRVLHQQQPGAGLYLDQLLSAASCQLQAAVQGTASDSRLEGQSWQLGQQLLQVAATVAHQAAVQQLNALGPVQCPDAKAHLVSVVLSLSAAAWLAGQVQGSSQAELAAVMACAEQVVSLVQDCQQLGVLGIYGCLSVRSLLLQLLLPDALNNSSSWPDSASIEALLTPSAGTAAGPLSQQPQRLQSLALLLEAGGRTWTGWAQLFQEGTASTSGGSSGWDQLLQLAMLVLQAVAAVQSAAAKEASAAAEAAARKAAKQDAAAAEADAEPDYFQDIFGSDDAHDDSAAAAADSGKAAVTYEHALSALAVQLFSGLAAHLRTSRAPGSSSWGQPNQRMLQLALSFIALQLTVQEPNVQEDEQHGSVPDLRPVQRAAQQAVQQACASCVAAAQQLQEVVLLAPAAADVPQPAVLLQLAGSVLLQHAAQAASRPQGSLAAASSAAGAGAQRSLLLAPWVHLATQLALAVEGATSGTTASSSGTSSSISEALQARLAWLLHPGRLSVVMATALAAPPAERAVIASMMRHCLQRCCTVLAAVSAASPATAAGTDSNSTGTTKAGLVSLPALALCALHACLSMLLWLLLPPALLPTGWLQQHLQATLQAGECMASGSSTAAAPAAQGSASTTVVQLQQWPWPAGLTWVSAQLQYKYETDELPVLLQSLGVSVDRSALEALTVLLPGCVPSCLPGIAAADSMVQIQAAVQHMQQQEVSAEARALLVQQDRPAEGSASGHAAGASSAWQSVEVDLSSSSSTKALVEGLLDSVLPAATAAWVTNSARSSSDTEAAVAYSCCHERALQLLLLLQPRQQESQQAPAASCILRGFNMFGSYQHLVQLQQQLAQLLAEYDAALQDSGSSSQLLPCSLSLQPSAVTEQPSHAPSEQQQHPAVTAVAESLSTVLAGALEDAVQRFGLFGTPVNTALLLKQQLHTCCVEVELLGQTVQVCCCCNAAACV